MEIKPLHDFIVVRKIDTQKVTSSGLMIMHKFPDKQLQGEVISVGPGRVSEDGNQYPMTVKKGDKVIFAKYAGSEIKVGGEMYLMMREDEVLGVLGNG